MLDLAHARPALDQLARLVARAAETDAKATTGMFRPLRQRAVASHVTDVVTLGGQALATTRALGMAAADTQPLADALHGLAALGARDLVDRTGTADAVIGAATALRGAIESHPSMDGARAAALDARRQMRELTDRHPSQLGRLDWIRVKELLDADPDGSVLRGPRQLAEVDDSLPTLVAGFIDQTDTPGTKTARYWAEWRLAMAGALDDPARARALGADLFQRDPTELSNVNWRTLERLVELPVARTGLVGPRQLDNVDDSLPTLLAGFADQTDSPGIKSRNYAAAWRVHLDGTLDDPARMRRMADDLTRRDPTTLSTEDWATFHQLLLRDADGAVLGRPRHLPDLDDSLPVLVAGFANHSDKPGRKAAAYFAAWRTEPLPVEQVVDELLATTPVDVPSARRWLEEANALAASLDVPTAFADARVDLRARLRQLERASRPSSSSMRPIHPDYAELGRAREQLRMLVAVERAGRAPQLPPVEPAAPPPAGSLTW